MIGEWSKGGPIWIMEIGFNMFQLPEGAAIFGLEYLHVLLQVCDNHFFFAAPKFRTYSDYIVTPW